MSEAHVGDALTLTITAISRRGVAGSLANATRSISGNAVSAPQPTYSCGGPSTPLSIVTNAALPWSVTLVPLSRADLASETLRQLTTDTFPHWSPGELNALSQQALNGGLNDYINSITAKQKMAGTSLADYLTQYARLLLGTTNLGYPYLAGG